MTRPIDSGAAGVNPTAGNLQALADAGYDVRTPTQRLRGESGLTRTVRGTPANQPTGTREATAAELARAGYGPPTNPTKGERAELAASDATTNAMMRADQEAFEAAARSTDYVPEPEPLSGTSQRMLGLS